MRVMSEEKLQKLAEFIKQYARDNNGESPSLADIMEYMDMVKSTAYRHILELEKRGIISAPLPGGQKRDILILDELIETNQL